MLACRQAPCLYATGTSVSDINWNLKNEESLPCWKQVLDNEKKVSAADTEIFGSSPPPPPCKMCQDTLLWEAGSSLQYLEQEQLPGGKSIISQAATLSFQ